MATGRYFAEHAPVPIVVQYGVGKSHLAQALGHPRSLSVLFISWTQLTANLKAACDTHERELATLTRIAWRTTIRTAGVVVAGPDGGGDLNDN